MQRPGIVFGYGFDVASATTMMVLRDGELFSLMGSLVSGGLPIVAGTISSQKACVRCE